MNNGYNKDVKAERHWGKTRALAVDVVFKMVNWTSSHWILTTTMGNVSPVVKQEKGIPSRLVDFCKELRIKIKPVMRKVRSSGYGELGS